MSLSFLSPLLPFATDILFVSRLSLTWIGEMNKMERWKIFMISYMKPTASLLHRHMTLIFPPVNIIAMSQRVQIEL